MKALNVGSMKTGRKTGEVDRLSKNFPRKTTERGMGENKRGGMEIMVESQGT